MSTEASSPNETRTRRPPNVGLPDDDYMLTRDTSPPVWVEEHAALLKGTPPPPGISLRTFEGWYRARLKEVDAPEAWSPSRRNGYTAMIDLWIRISTNRRPSPDAPSSTPLAQSPPTIPTQFE